MKRPEQWQSIFKHTPKEGQNVWVSDNLGREYACTVSFEGLSQYFWKPIGSGAYALKWKPYEYPNKLAESLNQSEHE